ncbi:jacalin-like lectin [Xanthomonas arboricola]|uniref:jacalin-like lectin n=1 Tax=Xanthomonas arboricola TaxID=56448 RepID=UPI0004D57DAE|nr:jacalin-like lectin [Xanthomonas arboricola]KER82204.1 endonuclease [Xanthomonas arboricola pv. celebensis]
MLHQRRTLVSLAITFGLACAGVAQAQTDVGVLDVLTYNVAGLPEGLSSGTPATNTALLAPKLAPYGLVNVQEDFNYHATLYAGDAHPYRTATSGGAAFGDGLNTLSNYPFNDFTRVKWNQCNGTDCLTPKGFSYMRVRLADGVLLDVYNAHPNAGVEAGDLSARRANIGQLSQFIQTWSAGNAVLVMMDSNTRYTRSDDNIRELIASNGLTDPWVELIKGAAPAAGAAPLLCGTPPTNSCEVVDKILYRDAPQLTLVANRYQLDGGGFYDSAGKPLSDHYPLHAQFGWAVGDRLRTSDQFGGPHGVPFNDLAGNPGVRPLSGVTLRGGARLDGVGVILDSGKLLAHGGSGGQATTLSLGANETLSSATFTVGKYNDRTRLFSLSLRTNKGRSVQVGSPTSESYTLSAPSGWHIAGFTGRAGEEIDKLGGVYAKD